MPARLKLPGRLLLEWTGPALASFLATLERIGSQDPATFAVFSFRVQRALELLLDQPGIGTSTQRTGIKTFPVPNTGHTIEYRVVGDKLRILRWYRQRRKRP